MRAICLYLHIHQPFRYRKFSAFEPGAGSYWEDAYTSKQSNERIFRKVAAKSYHPGLDMLERNLAEYPGFKVSLSITGTWLDQAARWDPALIEQLRRLVATGRVEIVGETYHHSLAFFYNRPEFEAQVALHRERIRQLFGVTPRVFRNTEFAYNDELAAWADQAGFIGILAEGWDKILGWRSPNHVYRPAGTEHIRLLLKNYRLSDDIAFRFSDRHWKEWPLTVEKYQKWLDDDCLRGPLINLFMDFETFGEHQWADTGIFKFMDRLIYSWLGEYDNKFLTVSEVALAEEQIPAGESSATSASTTSVPVPSNPTHLAPATRPLPELQPAGEISMPEVVTWADTERDLSAWVGSSMQQEALYALYALYQPIMDSGDPELIEDFRRLTTSDHAYYMCTKYWHDGDVHAYFSAYDSPYDAFIYYMNIIRDLKFRLTEQRPIDKSSNL